MVKFASLDELIEHGVIQLGRGKVISKKDIAAHPGEFPIYSSARENDGKFGEYGNFMFDEELITWSVDGGGNFFHRPRHKFSVTNVGGFLRILDKSALMYRYLYYALSYEHSKLTFDWITKAHPTVLRRLYSKIPTPSIAEQARIVDLLSRAESIVRMRRESEQKAKEIIPALFLDMFGDPATNPKEWEVKPLGELVRFVSGGTPSKSRAEYWQGSLPWVSPKDMKVPEIIDAEDHVSDQVPIQTSIKLIPAGTVLIVVRGMILVHTVPVAITRVAVTINQDMKALLVGGAVDADYLMWLLRISQQWLLTLVTTAAHGTRKIDTARLEALPVPVPPRPPQDSFVKHVKALLEINVGQGQAMDRAETAFQSLLAGVFGGNNAA